MRIEIDKYGNRNEYADDGNWLYQDRSENDRYFTDMVLLGKHEEPWNECTQAEREQWQKWQDEYNPQPEEEVEPENESVESVEQPTE